MTDPKVDPIFENATQWKEPMLLLRELVLEAGLTEACKWRQACYTYKGTNVAIISAFKEYCSLNFFKGSLLKDPEGMLIQQTENVQATRQLRFTEATAVKEQAEHIRRFLQEAIRVEEAGLKVAYKKTEQFHVPEELEEAFKADPSFKEAFEALTPGRQRGYLLHFAQPKQSQTRTARIDKKKEAIFKGKGMHDR